MQLFCWYKTLKIIPMNNILIPTQFESDTIDAIKTAIKYAESKSCTIVLTTVTDVPGSIYSPSFFLRTAVPEMTEAQHELLQECKSIVAATKNCQLKVHHQFGISAPLIKNLLEYFSVGLVILTQSYKSNTNRTQRHLLQLVSNCKCPILHMGYNKEERDFNKALYLEHTQTKIGIQDLQKIVSEKFSFKIVSQASVFEEQKPEDITPYLSETISKNNIDLLVETRKPEKNRLKKKTDSHVNEVLGLPVLSLYEERV